MLSWNQRTKEQEDMKVGNTQHPISGIPSTYRLRQWTGIWKLESMKYQNLFRIKVQARFGTSVRLSGSPSQASLCFYYFPSQSNATMDDLKAKQKKELKALDGEKRNQLKKTKATAGKGKKGKEALAA